MTPSTAYATCVRARGLGTPDEVEMFLDCSYNSRTGAVLRAPTPALTSPTLSEVEMAAPRICSVPGCDKPAARRGYCWAHYARCQRHGNPHGGSTSRGAAQCFLKEVVLHFNGNDCLIWPFNRNCGGYGIVRRDGHNHLVSRIACEHHNGPAPTPRHEAAHSCGNGHEGCCNPRHLSWKTRAENMADKVIHGTHNRGERHNLTNLTEDQVREIRARRGVETQQELAARFGVAQTTVSKIQRGESWIWLHDGIA